MTRQKTTEQPYAHSSLEAGAAASVQTIKFKRGLDLPIAGLPKQEIDEGPPVQQVALVGPDYIGMKPTMAVEVGDRVVTGQLLFSDKKQPGVCYTSPGCGTVVAIHRGQKRAFLSIVIELDGSESQPFIAYSTSEIDTIERADVIRQLVDSGVWTALRERPFDRVPDPRALGPVVPGDETGEFSCSLSPQMDEILRQIKSGTSDNTSPCPNSTVCSGSCGLPSGSDSCGDPSSELSCPNVPESNPAPAALFITAIDTRPLAADPAVVIQQRADHFEDGLRLLGRLGIEKYYLCTAPDATIPGADLSHIEQVAFAGPHPAGLVGTHIHSLKPVGRNRRVWHINYQDVIAIGHLFRMGKLDTERVVSLAGPSVGQPRLVRTRLGANLNELIDGQLTSTDSQKLTKKTVVKSHRVISGSVFGGRGATIDPGKGGQDQGGQETAFLGRFDLQVSVLSEFDNQELFGWIMPGLKKFSVKNVVLSKLLGSRHRFDFDTAMHGGRRAIVPIGAYQKVMPLEILPDFLLKAISIGDLELSESFGCLELTEEDIALLTYVCPGKADYGVMLRRVLDELAKEV